MLGGYLSIHGSCNQNKVFTSIPCIPSIGYFKDIVPYISQENKYCDKRNHRISLFFQVGIRVIFILNVSLLNVLNVLG